MMEHHKPFSNNHLHKRRARDSNPQPVSRHLISSQAASHSLTLPADSYQFIGRGAARQGKPAAALLGEIQPHYRPQNCYFPRRRNDPTRERRVRAAYSLHSARGRRAPARRRTHSGFAGLSTCDCCNSRPRITCLRSPRRPIRCLSAPSSRYPPRRSHR